MYIESTANGFEVGGTSMQPRRETGVTVHRLRSDSCPVKFFGPPCLSEFMIVYARIVSFAQPSLSDFRIN